MPHAETGLPSDVELMARYLRGDEDAGLRLVGRHAGAVASLGGARGGVAWDAGWLREVGELGLPVRAAVVSRHVHGALPGANASSDLLWHAFWSLDTSARIALWHREVEGQPVRQVAAYLGSDDRDCRAALVSAYRHLLRTVLTAQGRHGTCPDGERVVRILSAPDLPRRVRGTHVGSCSWCGSVAQTLSRARRDLRRALAEAALGESAAEYLAVRPPARDRVVGRRPATTRTQIRGRSRTEVEHLVASEQVLPG